MSEKEKKQAIVLGVLLAAFLAFVLIFDPFGLFGSDTQQQAAPPQEEEEEQEEEEVATEEETARDANHSERSERDGLPIYRSISNLDNTDDPAYTDDVWPVGGEDSINPQTRYFEVQGFSGLGIGIGTTRYGVDDYVTCTEGNQWKILQIKRQPWRFRAERVDPPRREWFNSSGYPMPDHQE